MTNNKYIERAGYYGKQDDMQKLDANPVAQFSLWYQEAVDSEEIEANAMALATVDEHALPHLRMVLGPVSKLVYIHCVLRTHLGILSISISNRTPYRM